MVYATAQDVSDELNGFTIDGSSTPTQTTVESWIAQESAILDRETGKFWDTQTITNEILDWDYSNIVRTNYAPIISITKLEIETNGLGATTENWVELTEGRTGSFITYKDEGEIDFFKSTYSPSGLQSVRITYDAGYATVPDVINAYITKKVALRVISTVLNSSSTKQGGSITVGAISISDPTTFGIDNATRLHSEVGELKASIGTFKIYRYNR